jgi:hypothetical protein
MPVSSILDHPLIREYLVDTAREVLRRRMVAARPRIVERMRKEGVTVAKHGKRHTIRFVLYWLCKSIIPNGHVADIARDYIDDQVVSDCAPDIDAGTSLPDVVTRTITATLERLK